MQMLLTFFQEKISVCENLPYFKVMLANNFVEFQTTGPRMNTQAGRCYLKKCIVIADHLSHLINLIMAYPVY